MRFASAGERFRDDTTLKVTRVDADVCTRSDQMSRETVHVEAALCVREVPEQVHTRDVELNAVAAVRSGEVVTEIITDIGIVDLDTPAREAHAAAAASGDGYAQDMLLEPGVIRNKNAQLGKIVVRDLNVDVLVHVAQIDRVVRCDITAHVTKSFRLRAKLAERFAHIHIGSIFHTEILSVIRIAQCRRALCVIDGTVNLVSLGIPVTHTAAAPVVDVRRVHGDISEIIAVCVDAADGDGTDDMVVGHKILLNNHTVLAQKRRSIVISVIAVRCSCSIRFSARAQTNRHHKRKHQRG